MEKGNVRRKKNKNIQKFFSSELALFGIKIYYKITIIRSVILAQKDKYINGPVLGAQKKTLEYMWTYKYKSGILKYGNILIYLIIWVRIIVVYWKEIDKCKSLPQKGTQNKF